jgi:predicted transcriptional regulator
MAQTTELPTRRTLYLKLESADQRTQDIASALSFRTRVQILELLAERLYNLSELANLLSLPLSTVSGHVSVLERAGLLITEQQPAIRGTQKACARAYDTIVLQLPDRADEERTVIEESMPIGAYMDCGITPTCGLLSDRGIIGSFDEPGSFYDPKRIEAQLLWFHSGYVEYRFPKRVPAGTRVTSLSLSFEACSEAPLHHDDWPSDITVWVNGTELGTWTSPADFGGTPGKLNPTWWEPHNTQYGSLKVWRVDAESCVLDGLTVSPVRLDDLRLESFQHISVRLGVKEDARHVGGMNLFGRKFGNHPQDLVLRIQCS